MAAYSAVLIHEVVITEFANSARKLPNPMNRFGGSSGITRKNASTVVATVGTNDSTPMMNTTSGDDQDVRRAAIRPRGGALNRRGQPPLRHPLRPGATFGGPG